MANKEKEILIEFEDEGSDDNGYTAYELLNEISETIGVLQGIEELDINLYPQRKATLFLKWLDILEEQTRRYAEFYE